ncbi:MAG: hypothetical protein IT292_05620 [Deltaproteobacteria bacterium]|nr:hypothetical protein [Deltaproteobacteria bacterium]
MNIVEDDVTNVNTDLEVVAKSFVPYDQSDGCICGDACDPDLDRFGYSPFYD